MKINIIILLMLGLVLCSSVYAEINVTQGVVFNVGTTNIIYNTTYNFTVNNITFGSTNLVIDKLNFTGGDNSTIYNLTPMQIFVKNSQNNNPLTNFNLNITSNNFNGFFNGSNNNITTVGLSEQLSLTATKTNFFNKTIIETNLFNSFNIYNISVDYIGNFTINIFNSSDGVKVTKNISLIYFNEIHESEEIITNGSITLSNLVEGNRYTFLFTAQGFNQTIYTIIYSATLNKTLNVYMAEKSFELILIVQDTALNFIDEAQVTVTTFVNGTKKIIGSTITDVVGQARFFLKQNKEHTIQIQKEGFATKTFDINVNQDLYTIKIQLIQVFDFDTPLNDVLWDFFPKENTLEANLNTFSLNVTAASNDLEYFKINIYNDTNLISTVINNFDTSGGEIQTSVNLLPYLNNTIKAEFLIKRQGQSEYFYDHEYFIVDYVPLFNGSMSDARDWAKSNIVIRDKIIISIILSFIIFLVLFKSNVGGFFGTIILVLSYTFTAWLLYFPLYLVLIVTILDIVILMSIINLSKRGSFN